VRTVGVLEAKTSLSALLDEVEATGEAIVITRHGKPVARLEREPSTRGARRLGVAERARAFREKQARDPEWDSLSWEELKAIARDEAGR